jgi:hypothetical protein
VNAVQYLVAIGGRRASKTKRGNGRNQGPTAQFKIRHIVLPFDNCPLGGSVDGEECTLT